jgi:hypothetical protein
MEAEAAKASTNHLRFFSGVLIQPYVPNVATRRSLLIRIQILAVGAYRKYISGSIIPGELLR